jgi:hypothetical protein
MRSSQLSRRQKRLLVLGRLSEPDADEKSDRALARELGVSQPFVGELRRGRRRQTESGGTPDVSSSSEAMARDDSTADGAFEGLEPESNAETRAFHDNTPRVRWVPRSEWHGRDSHTRAEFDWDPYA